jgi:general L-amino acid transport system permease protein
VQRLRGALTARQGVVLLILAVVTAFLISNVAANLQRRGLGVSFEFLARPAGFDVPFKLIEFSSRDSYGRAALAGLLNTILVSSLAVVTATILGFLLGTFMLSPNPLLRRSAFGVVETVKNTPQVLQLLFWYVLILNGLPGARESYRPFEGVFLNVRGLFLPSFQVTTADGQTWLGSICLAVLLLALALIATWRAPQGVQKRASAALLVAAGGAALAFGRYSGATLSTSVPELRGFNFQGGMQIVPELIALWIGLAVYASSFIADLVRGAVLAVPRGQEEAGNALGLTHWQSLRLVRLPQALQIIVPPLVSQYLNITKSSTLGIAIAYPEIMTVVGGTTLNQTGHAIECMLVIMLLFIALNLAVSLVMNRYNRAIASRGAA